jgi:hypothetical protein
VVRAWPRRASLTRDADGNLGFALRLLVGFIATSRWSSSSAS